MSAGKAHRWMSEADAVRHICEIMESSEADAEKELHDAVLDGDVEARARDAEFRSITAIQRREWQQSNLSLRVWRHSILYWADDHIRISVDEQEELLRIDATGIELRSTDVLRLWPAQESGKTGPITRSVSRRGRMLKHEWPRAAFYLADRIWRDDLTEQKAREVLKEWFAERGDIPDDKDIRDWVSEFFKDEKRGK